MKHKSGLLVAFLLFLIMLSGIFVVFNSVNKTHDSLEMVSDGLYLRLSDPIIIIGKDDIMMINNYGDWCDSKTGYILTGVKYSQLPAIADYYGKDENAEIFKIKDSFADKPYQIRLRRDNYHPIDSIYPTYYYVELTPAFSNILVGRRAFETIPDTVISNNFNWDYLSSYYIELPDCRVLIPDSYWVDEDNIQHPPITVDSKLITHSNNRDTINTLLGYPVFEEEGLINKRVRLSLIKENGNGYVYRGVLIQ